MMGQEHIRNIAFLENAEVVAIAEPDEGMRKAASFLVPDATAVDSLDALLHLDGIDALVIASPNHLHVGQMQAIASRRALPLLVEKPVYTDPSHTAQLAEFAARYPALVWVAMEYRYMPPIASFLSRVHEETGGIKNAVDQGTPLPVFGESRRLEPLQPQHRRHDGGKMLSLFRSDAPCHAKRAGARDGLAGQAVNHLDETYDGEVPDIWDHGYVIVDFENGARGMLELCMFADGSRYQEEICAVGPQGKIEAFVPGPTRFWPAQLGTPPVAKVIVSPRDPKGPMELDIPVDRGPAGSRRPQWRDLLPAPAVSGGDPPRPSASGVTGRRRGSGADGHGSAGVGPHRPGRGALELGGLFDVRRSGHGFPFQIADIAHGHLAFRVEGEEVQPFVVEQIAHAVVS
jgi:myo-inositol 2-dehydrogenase/D-chiro-inositol 1-dehydrogenase